MFEMTTTQQQAATVAMNGSSPALFMHLILYFIAASAVVWFLFIFIGMASELNARKADIGDLFGKFSIAVFILICTGALIAL